MRYTTFILGFAVLVAALPASAQDEDKRVDFALGGGYTFSTGEVHNHLGDGYNVNVGLTVNANKMVGIEALYGFNGLGKKTISVPLAGAPGGSTVPTRASD